VEAELNTKGGEIFLEPSDEPSLKLTPGLSVDASLTTSVKPTALMQSSKQEISHLRSQLWVDTKRQGDAYSLIPSAKP
jgi:hypothetical protein